MSATAKDHLSDPELLEAAWDLEPLVEGEGNAGVERLLEEAGERANAVAERYAGKIAELDAEGLGTAMRELETINELVGRAALVRLAPIRHRHSRSRARRAPPGDAGTGDRDRNQASVLRARVGGAR